MSKEELAQEHHFIQTGLSVGKNQSHADLTLEYAKEQAIGFAEWIRYSGVFNNTHKKWEFGDGIYTTEELYELYLSTLK